jgi:hypothetical protein
MKSLNFEQMEIVRGGQTVAAADFDTVVDGASVGCKLSIASAIVFGTGGVIAAASGPIGWLAFAMVANYAGWGMAAYSCSH